MISLEQVDNGRNVEVQEVSTSALKVKLLEMGVIAGKCIKVLYRAPFGDPIAVDIGGYVLSLRKEEAALIQVAPIESIV